VIVVYLLALAGAVSMTAPRVLPHADWVYRAPRLALAAWYAVITATGLAVAAALASLTLGWPWVRATVCTWALWCLEAIRGAHGTVGRTIAAMLLLTLILLGVRAVLLAGRVGHMVAQRRREHAGMLTVLGAPSAQLGATVVDCPVPVAYVVPGRPARIVISTGTLGTLVPAQLAAVIAHERAHADGRHQLLADGARLLAAAFPHTAVFAAAHTQIDRLVEMRADEVAAAGGHARLDLARALVTMAEAANRQPTGVPAGAVAATGGDALERVHRLLTPPAPLHPAARLTAWAALLTLAAAPLLLLTVTALVPALAACPSIV
jgi:Zn-dependent protease with chaperone function